MDSVEFEKQLGFGQVGENEIVHWLLGKGYSVLPAYEKILDTGKGPRIYMPERRLIAPDLFTWKGTKALWVEAKRKTAFSWHRITNRWCTGIDLRHYEDYLEFSNKSPWPFWLLFLHEGGQAKDSPETSPRGLFGNNLAVLRKCENHRSDNWGKSGMVYWAYESLFYIAPPFK